MQILRARTGTTALIALVGPSRSLHVATLGECETRKHKKPFLSPAGLPSQPSSWFTESPWRMGSNDLQLEVEQSTQCP